MKTRLWLPPRGRPAGVCMTLEMSLTGNASEFLSSQTPPAIPVAALR